MKHPERIKFNCERCGKPSSLPPSRYEHLTHHYCSKECTNADNDKNKVTYICDDKDCNVKKTIYKSTYDKTLRHFCSRKCHGKNRLKFTRVKKAAESKKRGLSSDFKERWEKIKW